MVSLDVLRQRVASKEKELRKLKSRQARIEKAKASGWTDNYYMYTEADLDECIENIERAESMLAKYEVELEAAEQRASTRDIPAILDFIEDWKAAKYDYYAADLKAAFKELYEVSSFEGDIFSGDYSPDELRELQKELHARRQAYEAKLKGEWSHIVRYMKHGDDEYSLQNLKTVLDRAADRKYDFLVDRISAIVGEIVDASDLRVGSNGELSGYVDGTEGSAEVRTIGAGSHDSGTFQFRTIIKPAN